MADKPNYKVKSYLEVHVHDFKFFFKNYKIFENNQIQFH
jgi:hypothetical protein